MLSLPPKHQLRKVWQLFCAAVSVALVRVYARRLRSHCRNVTMAALCLQSHPPLSRRGCHNCRSVASLTRTGARGVVGGRRLSRPHLGMASLDFQLKRTKEDITGLYHCEL